MSDPVDLRADAYANDNVDVEDDVIEPAEAVDTVDEGMTVRCLVKDSSDEVLGR